MTGAHRSQSRQTAVGGYVWPRWVSWYTRSNSYNYAVSGAECSTAITPRNNRFQGIKEYEVDAFVADLAHRVGGRPFLEAAPETTVYASWIGTNDLGAGAFLTGEQAPGKTRDDYVACVFETFDRLYAAGGRRFVLMNVIPLDQLPLYGLPERGGLAWSKYWPDKPANLTATSLHMKEIVEYVNGAFKVRMGRMKASKKYPGAQMALFDVWKLVCSHRSVGNLTYAVQQHVSESDGVFQRHRAGQCNRICLDMWKGNGMRGESKPGLVSLVRRAASVRAGESAAR